MTYFRNTRVRLNVSLFRLRLWLFRWNAEPENEGGSIVFTICGIIHFLKYKESTLIYWGKQPKFKQARKYVSAF